MVDTLASPNPPEGWFQEAAVSHYMMNTAASWNHPSGGFGDAWKDMIRSVIENDGISTSFN